MNRPIQWLLLTLAAASLAAAVAGADPAAAPAPTTTPAPAPRVKAKALRLPPPYNVLNLTDAQKEQFADKLRERRDAVAEWETDRGVRRAELKKEIADAQAAKDRDKVKMLTTESAELDRERRSIEAKYQADFDAILTLEQHQELEGREEYGVMLQKLGRTKLTKQQKEDVRARVMKAAPNAYGKDAQAKSDVWAAVLTDIGQNVLTPEQRLLLKPAPTTHPSAH